MIILKTRGECCPSLLMMKGNSLLFLLAACFLEACLQDIPSSPLASFTVQNNNCNAPCSVTFTNTSQNAARYKWYFDDQGSSSTTQDPTFMYNTAGEYTVKLIASSEGGSHGAQQTITIKGGIPAKIWDKTFGGSSGDGLSSMVATSDGGFLLGGSSNSHQGEDKSENTKGLEDYWVVKISEMGPSNGTKLLAVAVTTS